VRAEYETAAGHAPLFAMPFHGAVQIISRSSTMHGLERRLVRFLRLHRATLCRFSCLIHEGCGPDPAGFSGPYSGVLCHPFEGHCCRPSAPDTSTTALAARKSTSCSLVGLSLGDRRSFGPLSCTYVISFPGPHSELPVSLFSLVHRDRHSRPARAPVHAPAHLPSLVASPITHTPGRSESTRLCAPRGGCCRFVVRSAGSLVGRLSTTGWAVLASSQPQDFARGDARWFREQGCRMRQCDMRATAKASDGMLLSGVPIRGCRSPLPPGPTSAFPEIGLGLLPTATGGRATGTPTSVTALGGILVGDSRVEAGAS
jgi:hypothetical protein